MSATRGPRPAGFTLVEVLVALVVVQVGVLGMAASLLLAARTLRSAAVDERVAADLAWLHDSLSVGWSAGQAERLRPWGRLTWTVTDGGRAALAALVDADTVRIDAWLPPPP